MNNTIRKLVIALLLSLSIPVTTSDINEFNKEVWLDTYVCEDSYAVLFGNGIWTTQKKAMLSLHKLQTLVSADPNFQALDKPVMFNNAYNSTMGVFADLFEPKGGNNANP